VRLIALAESSADEAAIRILTEAIRGPGVVTWVEPPPTLRSRGWPAVVRENLPLVIRHAYYSSDAAGVILGLLRKNAGNGIYHVVNSGAATWFEFARQIIEEAGISARVIPVTSGEYPTVAVRPAHTVLDNRKASKIAGEIHHWKHALRQYLMGKGHLQFAEARSQGAGPGSAKRATSPSG